MRKLVLGAIVAATFLTPTAAQAQSTADCRASAIRGPVIGEPFVANPAYSPCADDQAGVPREGVSVPGLATIRVFDAQTGTNSNPVTGEDGPHGGWAWASVAFAHVTLPGVDLRVYGISSTAGSKCLGPNNPDLGGSSAIAYVILNGRAIPVSLPNTAIPLLGLGTLHLNYGTKTQDEVVTRAVWLDLAGDQNDVVISEARASRLDRSACT